jgi:hypothetical protein
MPILLRLAHVDELPAGTSREFRVRGERIRLAHVGDVWAALAGKDAPMAGSVGEADLAWARQNGARTLRVVVRGTYVHVAIDADREAAKATVHESGRPPAISPAG